MSSATTTPVQGAASRVPVKRSPWLRPKYLLFALIGLMYLYVLWNNERFLVDSKDPDGSVLVISPGQWAAARGSL